MLLTFGKRSVSLESVDIVSCSSVKYIMIFLQSRTQLNATYSCPWLKGGKLMLRSTLNSVWDRLSLYVMVYARCNGSCNIVSQYDLPCINLNLNEMCGILLFHLAQSPTVKTSTQYLCMAIIRTLELLASPRPFIAWVTRQILPTFKMSSWLVTPYFLNPVSIVALSIFFKWFVWVINLREAIFWPKSMFYRWSFPGQRYSTCWHLHY